MHNKLINRKKLKTNENSFDYQTVFLVIILSLLGVMFMADASAPLALRSFGDKYYFVKQQIVWLAIGYVTMFIFSKIKYTFWQKISPFIMFSSIIFLLMVFIPGLGKNVLGAKRWIFIGASSFQPSEFSKIAIVLYLSTLISKEKKLFSLLMPLIIVIFLIMLQPDLGTSLIVFATGFSLVLFSGINILNFIVIVSGSVLAVLGLILSSSYRRARLTTFLSEATDPLGQSYHVRQVLIALGSGGLFGVGLGQSRQKQLFLPETATDSIFAIIAEEVGFIGSMVILTIFMLLILRMFRIASKSPDKFSQSIVVGIASWLGIQTFLNVGSMVALVPLTGIPLPLFSYGGTSLVMLFAALGILLNISKYAKG